jgi:hypothetical protein
MIHEETSSKIRVLNLAMVTVEGKENELQEKIEYFDFIGIFPQQSFYTQYCWEQFQRSSTFPSLKKEYKFGQIMLSKQNRTSTFSQVCMTL